MRILILKWDRLYLQALTAIARRTFKGSEVLSFQRAKDALRALAIAPVAMALVGVETPDLDGLDFIPDIISSQSSKQTVIIAERSDRRTLSIFQPLKYDGLVDANTADRKELQTALSAIACGGRYTSHSIKVKLSEGTPFKGFYLSAQEELVLSVIGDGADDSEASKRLDLSAATVHNHRTRIMSKLGLHHRGELICYAMSNFYLRRSQYGVLHPGFERILREKGNGRGMAVKL